MRSQRLVACLLLLQGARRLTAGELAATLEVSPRTIYRDVEALCEAGVPIHAERGSGGGIVLADGYRRALAAFGEAELRALFAVTESPLRDLGETALPTALRKLSGALSEGQRSAVEAGRRTVLVDQNRWFRAVPPAGLLARLRDAVDAERVLEIAYRDRSGALSTRELQPLGLIAKAGTWYLVAHETAKGERTFRADRIERAAETGARFTRPPTFDLEAHWRASVSAMERRDDASPYVATLRVRRDAIAPFAGFWNVERLVETADALTIRVGFPSRAVAAAMVVAYATDVELVEPDDLREAIVASATAALARHGERSPELAGAAR